MVTDLLLWFASVWLRGDCFILFFGFQLAIGVAWLLWVMERGS